MALLFLEGFDKYGQTNTDSATVIGLLQTGDWNTASGTPTIVTPLSATGLALQVGANSLITKTLSGNYARLIGGFRFNSITLGSTLAMQFLDGASLQSAVTLNVTTGTISVKNGSFSTGTVLGTSVAAVAANSIHYLEFDVTFGNSAAYEVWLDGVSILSGTGDTMATTNAFANGVRFVTSATASNNVIDDFYLFDSTGTIHNATLRNSPRVETAFPVSDNTVQFSVGAATLGNSVLRATSGGTYNNNRMVVKAYTPTVNCTLNAITMFPQATSATNNLRPVLYADSSGLPGSLIDTGSTVTGMTIGVPLTLPLTTPQSLTAGTQYWLGFMFETGGIAWYGQAAGGNTRIVNSTFLSGAPSTFPGGSATEITNPTHVIGNITLASPVNVYSLTNPPQGNFSYVFEGTVGEEDLYNFPPIGAPVVHAVAVKASLAKSDSGAKTASLRLKSGSTNSAGSIASVTPGTTYGWGASYFPTDPDTSAAWTVAGVNAAQAGFRVAS